MPSPDSPTPANRLPGADPAQSAPAPSNGTDGESLLPGLVTAQSAPRPAPARAPATGDLTLAELAGLIQSGISIVRSRIWSALVCALVVAGAFAFLLARMRPEKTAVTTLLAQSTLDQIMRVGAQTPVGQQDEENSLRNHLSVMQSRRFTIMLAGEFSPAETASILAPYLQPGEAPSKAILEEFLSAKINIERERGREFFTIKFSHPDGTIAVLVADRVTATYQKLVEDQFRQANLDATGLLQQQANTLQSDISKLEDQRRDYRLKESIISVEESQGLLAERLKRLDQNLSEIRIQRVRLETQATEAKTDLARSPTPFENPMLANYGNNAILRQNLDQLRGQQKVLATTYGPNHPKMKEVLLQIAATETTLKNNFDLAYRDLESQLDAARTTEKQLQGEFTESFQASIEVDKKANRYLILGAEIDAKRGTLAELLNKVNRTVVSSQLPSDVMRVVDPAYIDKPRISRVILLGSVGVLFVLGTFVFVPFVIHAFDKRLRATADIEKSLGKELVGCVPRLGRVRVEDRPHIVRNNVDLAHVESFMSIASQIEFNSKHVAPRALIVTSTFPGEGKSLLVSNLGSAFTKIGRKTLIIDCDFRRPSQHLIHGVTSGRGFLSWAKAGYPTAALLESTGPLGLTLLADGTYLIPAGGDDPQPAQYLVAKATQALFQAFRQSYEVVILDTPPVGLFQDALILSRYAQDTLLVAREARAPVAQIKRVLTEIDRGSAPVLGVIFNDFSPRSAHSVVGYRHEAAKYGYKYRYAEKAEKDKKQEKAKEVLKKM